MKYETYYSKLQVKIHPSKDTCIAITGATGSIGKSLVRFFSKTEAKLILIGRSKGKLETLKKEFNLIDNKTILIPLDLSNTEAVSNIIPFLKENNITLFYNNAGVFHQPIQMKDGLDQSFLVDYLTPVFFMKSLSENTNTIFVSTASISYHYHSFEPDIQGLDISSKIKRYGFLKRLLMMESIYLREKGVPSYLAHPGISYTGLFSKENKAYPAWLLSLIKWPMKFLFMSPDKASLSLIEAGFVYPEISSYLGPNGLFHGWGYPSVQKIDQKLFLPEQLEYLNKETDSLIEKHFL